MKISDIPFFKNKTFAKWFELNYGKNKNEEESSSNEENKDEENNAI